MICNGVIAEVGQNLFETRFSKENGLILTSLQVQQVNENLFKSNRPVMEIDGKEHSKEMKII